MNNKVVMTAIERRMDFIFNKVICNPNNIGKSLKFFEREIEELYKAYMELRGNTSYDAFVDGFYTEVNYVQNIYELTKRNYIDTDMLYTVYKNNKENI